MTRAPGKRSPSDCAAVAGTAAKSSSLLTPRLACRGLDGPCPPKAASGKRYLDHFRPSPGHRAGPAELRVLVGMADGRQDGSLASAQSVSGHLSAFSVDPTIAAKQPNIRR
ncbi:hypothetical protein KL948_005069 [Ogataea haglerorum]|uniref:Uncharacterized protein n=1 Tax=Ogataea haglerorum TaxID=1937702 RepID=A0ABQ7RA15_9ASCO|nr:hypothetical protein KL914_005202 [Ogataea haglerorum]KAG7725156.1 hypothetical protein KL948_005069 [Ogataea haglerorum]KAG7733543.1 hypothetical protein KL932_005143 [Ogataea haglerorum]KAG7762045.1 hypothetical protein KL946_004909 [Ogataea haglerorum]